MCAFDYKNNITSQSPDFSPKSQPFLVADAGWGAAAEVAGQLLFKQKPGATTKAIENLGRDIINVPARMTIGAPVIDNQGRPYEWRQALPQGVNRGVILTPSGPREAVLQSNGMLTVYSPSGKAYTNVPNDPRRIEFFTFDGAPTPSEIAARENKFHVIDAHGNKVQLFYGPRGKITQLINGKFQTYSSLDEVKYAPVSFQKLVLANGKAVMTGILPNGHIVVKRGNQYTTFASNNGSLEERLKSIQYSTALGVSKYARLTFHPLKLADGTLVDVGYFKGGYVVRKGRQEIAFTSGEKERGKINEAIKYSVALGQTAQKALTNSEHYRVQTKYDPQGNPYNVAVAVDPQNKQHQQTAAKVNQQNAEFQNGIVAGAGQFIARQAVDTAKVVKDVAVFGGQTISTAFSGAGAVLTGNRAGVRASEQDLAVKSRQARNVAGSMVQGVKAGVTSFVKDPVKAIAQPMRDAKAKSDPYLRAGEYFEGGKPIGEATALYGSTVLEVAGAPLLAGSLIKGARNIRNSGARAGRLASEVAPPSPPAAPVAPQSSSPQPSNLRGHNKSTPPTRKGSQTPPNPSSVPQQPSAPTQPLPSKEPATLSPKLQEETLPSKPVPSPTSVMFRAPKAPTMGVPDPSRSFENSLTAKLPTRPATNMERFNQNPRFQALKSSNGFKVVGEFQDGSIIAQSRSANRNHNAYDTHIIRSNGQVLTLNDQPSLNSSDLANPARAKNLQDAIGEARKTDHVNTTMLQPKSASDIKPHALGAVAPNQKLPRSVDQPEMTHQAAPQERALETRPGPSGSNRIGFLGLKWDLWNVFKLNGEGVSFPGHATINHALGGNLMVEPEFLVSSLRQASKDTPEGGLQKIKLKDQPVYISGNEPVAGALTRVTKGEFSKVVQPTQRFLSNATTFLTHQSTRFSYAFPHVRGSIQNIFRQGGGGSSPAVKAALQNGAILIPDLAEATQKFGQQVSSSKPIMQDGSGRYSLNVLKNETGQPIIVKDANGIDHYKLAAPLTFDVSRTWHPGIGNMALDLSEVFPVIPSGFKTQELRITTDLMRVDFAPLVNDDLNRLTHRGLWFRPGGWRSEPVITPANNSIDEKLSPFKTSRYPESIKKEGVAALIPSDLKWHWDNPNDPKSLATTFYGMRINVNVIPNLNPLYQGLSSIFPGLGNLTPPWKSQKVEKVLSWFGGVSKTVGVRNVVVSSPSPIYQQNRDIATMYNRGYGELVSDLRINKPPTSALKEIETLTLPANAAKKIEVKVFGSDPNYAIKNHKPNDTVTIDVKAEDGARLQLDVPAALPQALNAMAATSDRRAAMSEAIKTFGEKYKISPEIVRSLTEELQNPNLTGQDFKEVAHQMMDTLVHAEKR